jgi:hypothetical protein
MKIPPLPSGGEDRGEGERLYSPSLPPSSIKGEGETISMVRGCPPGMGRYLKFNEVN